MLRVPPDVRAAQHRRLPRAEASNASPLLPCRQCCICSRNPPRFEMLVLPLHWRRLMSPTVTTGWQGCAIPPALHPRPGTISQYAVQTEMSYPEYLISSLHPSNLKLQIPSSSKFLLMVAARVMASALRSSSSTWISRRVSSKAKFSSSASEATPT